MNKAIEGNMDIIKSAARLKTSANKVYKQKLTFLPLNDTSSMLQLFLSLHVFAAKRFQLTF